MKKLQMTANNKKGRVRRHVRNVRHVEDRDRLFDAAEAIQEGRRMMAMAKLFPFRR